jgi:hypothetical protein
MANNQCYFNGDFYQCATATNAGESPATAPAKWRRVNIPQDWRWFLTQLTYAHLLELDGQTDKAATTRTKALESDRIGLTATIRREAQAEMSSLGRPSVQTPYNPNLNGITGYPNANLPCKR